MDAEGENASTLEFGKAFSDDVQCLSNAEVAIVLEQQKTIYETRDIPVTPAFAKTLQHVKRYGPTTDRETTVAASTELRQELEAFEQYTDAGQTKLHQFEIAALANLMQADSTAEEAIALIPSLGKYSEDDIENILESIRKHVSSRIYG